jgi:hypothetical protein
VSAGHVFQEPGSFSCLGCVAAMIVGDPDLFSVALHSGHIGRNRPYRMTEIAAFLASRGYLLGAFAARPLTSRRILECHWPRRFRSLLIVQSQSGKGNHAVYWDGMRVLDPERDNSGLSLKDYKVLEWWPVIQVENHGEL